MKLGLDCRELRTGSLTGIGRFVSNLLRALSDIPNPPELFLYGNQHTSLNIPEKLLSNYSHRPRQRRKNEAAAWWWDRVTLPKMARRDRLDLFLSPDFKAPGIRSCPVVITIHDLLLLQTPPELSGHSAVYCRAWRSFAANFARRAAVILTVSEYTRRDIIARLDVPPGKVRVVGNCVQSEYHPLDDPARIDDAKRRHHISGDYLLYVGSFAPHKNIDGLLRTYDELDRELRDRYALVLAGSADPYTPAARSTISSLGLSDRVLLPGYVSEEDLPALYAGASAFVTLSRWEGFGLPLLEAMACGTPVLCSAGTSMPEVAGGAALFADPDDHAACLESLTRILTDDPLRAELKTKGPARAANYTPARFASLILDALTLAVDSPSHLS